MKAFLIVSTLLVVSVSAHFQMQFPEPRGPFVEDTEPMFCDGYNDAVSDRQPFPLTGGFININSEHPQWTAAVLISLEANPTNFSVFNTTTTGVELPFAVPFFSATGEGVACIPVNIGSLNIAGVGNGTNVTLQVQFSGGDGNLFQCTDITLLDNFTVPSNVTCTNRVTESNTQTSTSPGATNTTNGVERLIATTTGMLCLCTLFAIVIASL